MKQLERQLELNSVVAISISAMIGSGIFVLPGMAAGMAGSYAWLAYVFAALCVLPAAFSKGELSTAMATSGGTYVYMERTFGPLVGTITGLGLWLSLLLKSSFALIGFGAYLTVFTDLAPVPVALFLLSIITLLNIIGIKAVGAVQRMVVIASLIGLATISILGMVLVPAESFPLEIPTGENFLAACAFVFVSYAGVTKIAAIAEEVKRPERNLPYGMLISLGMVTIVYAGVVFVLTKHIPPSNLGNDLRPIYSLAQSVGGTKLGLIAAILGVVTLTSMANSGILAASRFPFAMSRDNLLPSTWKQVHSKFLTPLYSIACTAAVMVVAILFLDVYRLAKLASAFQIIVFIGVNIALIVLRETGVQWYKPSYRSPLYPWIQIFGIISCLVLLMMLGKIAFIAIASVFVLGTLLFAFYGSKNVSRQGVLRLYGKRAIRSFARGKHLGDVREVLREKSSHMAEAREEFANAISGERKPAIVIPLFGQERSAEMLVEIGAALAENQKIQVAHLKEVPEQTILDAFLQDNVSVDSMERRVLAIKEEKNLDVEFDAFISHDVIRTVRRFSEDDNCQWLIMGWEGRAAEGLMFKNKLNWFLHDVHCNVGLYHDVGVRYIRRILAYCNTPRYASLTRSTAQRLAEIYNASITFLSVVEKTAPAEAEQEQLDFLNSMKEKCSASADCQVVRSNDEIDAVSHLSVGYDLLVTAAPRPKNLWQTFIGTRADKLTEKSACSVLRLTQQNRSAVEVVTDIKDYLKKDNLR